MIKVALAGNPNSGKTTLFNALTGSNQFVGNWPGVTVEKKEGTLKGNKQITVVDLPGIYSLSPYSLEEVVARNFLLQEKPDLILNIVDGSNLERNLYLTTQLAEMGIPMILALNMMDVVEKQKDQINLEKLQKAFDCPVLPISALKGQGLSQLVDRLEQATLPTPAVYDDRLEQTISQIQALLPDVAADKRRFYAIKTMERDDKLLEVQQVLAQAEPLITQLEQELDDDGESMITNQRYQYLTRLLATCYIKQQKPGLTLSDGIDRVVTHRFLALPIFAAVMFLVYFVSVTTVGSWATDWANDGLFGEGFTFFEVEVPGIPVFLHSLLTATGCSEWLISLLLDGIVAGVGAVLGFVPQMLVLFFFLAFLESCGYMARIAFIMDRIFRKFGLSGKSFIPMLVGTGCGVPGIMASRTIEQERDRRMTIITTTFIPCGAKLPIIALIAGAMFQGASWVAPSAYFVGIAAIICSGVLLKKTALFTGDPAPFVMELPAYHMPALGHVLSSMWERAWSFIKKAGTVILLSTICIWFLSSFGVVNGRFVMVEDLSQGFLAGLGSMIAWIFSPLGWGDWKAAVAAITGLVAKENVVGTFGVLYGFAQVAEDGAEIWGNLVGSFTVLSAYSFLVFNLLCAPCFAAIGAIRREMNSGAWTLIAIGYQTGLAYVTALCIFQLGTFVTTGSFGFFTLLALLCLVVFLYLLLRPEKGSISQKITTEGKFQ